MSSDSQSVRPVDPVRRLYMRIDLFRSTVTPADDDDADLTVRLTERPRQPAAVASALASLVPGWRRRQSAKSDCLALIDHQRRPPS